MKTAVFLYNPESGKGKIARNVGCISTIFQAYGYDVTPQRIDFTANPFDGNETIDLMVVAGGDGTVNYAVNAMKRKGLDIPIGVIPAGTANDFAGAVGMSREPLEAARQIASGAVDRVDVGRVNDLYFVNIFSFGIFTTTSQRTPDERKHKIGKLAYIIEGVKEFLHDARRAAGDRGRRRAVRPAVADGADLQRRDGGRFPPGAAVVDQGRAVRLHPAGEEDEDQHHQRPQVEPLAVGLDLQRHGVHRAELLDPLDDSTWRGGRRSRTGCSTASCWRRRISFVRRWPCAAIWRAAARRSSATSGRGGSTSVRRSTNPRTSTGRRAPNSRCTSSVWRAACA